jgi:hypothetical protein
MAGLVPLFLCLPLIRANMMFASTFWAKVQWIQLPMFYYKLLIPAAVVLFALVIVVALATKISPGARELDVPAYEIAAAAGFALIPVLAISLGKFATHVFTDRYALSAILGIAILLAWSLAYVTCRSTVAGCASFLVCFGWFVFSFIETRRDLMDTAQSRAATYRSLQSEMNSSLPMVIASPHLFFEISYDADIGNGRRPVYLTDLTLATKYTGSNSGEINLLGLRQLAPIDVEDFEKFLAAHKQFLLYSSTSPYEWVTGEVLRHGARVTVKQRRGGDMLSLVSMESPGDDAARSSALPALSHH